MASRRNQVQAISLGRETCFNCMRPVTHCLCKLVVPFEMHCNLLILQHPQERKKYYGTARIVNAAIQNCKLSVGELFDSSSLARFLAGRRPYLLFPSQDAAACQDVQLGSDSTLIVLDGTWSQAGKLFRRSPELSTIPKLTFTKPFASRYRIRKQPKPMYLSTIEAVAYFLSESSTNCEPEESGQRINNSISLLEAFDLMVEKQLQYWPRVRKIDASIATNGSEACQLDGHPSAHHSFSTK